MVGNLFGLVKRESLIGCLSSRYVEARTESYEDFVLLVNLLRQPITTADIETLSAEELTLLQIEGNPTGSHSMVDPTGDHSVSYEGGKRVLSITRDISWGIRYLRELAILSTLRHPHLDSADGISCGDDDPIKVIMPRCSPLPLPEEMPLETKITLCWRILHALIFLHCNKYAHCNVCYDSIIICNRDVRLSNFSASRVVDEIVEIPPKRKKSRSQKRKQDTPTVNIGETKDTTPTIDRKDSPDLHERETKDTAPTIDRKDTAQHPDKKKTTLSIDGKKAMLCNRSLFTIDYWDFGMFMLCLLMGRKDYPIVEDISQESWVRRYLPNLEQSRVTIGTLLDLPLEEPVVDLLSNVLRIDSKEEISPTTFVYHRIFHDQEYVDTGLILYPSVSYGRYDHKTIALIIDYCRNNMSEMASSILFLSVDIAYRTIHITSEDHYLACIWMAWKYIGGTCDPWGLTRPPLRLVPTILKAEVQIFAAVNGQIYRPYLYDNVVSLDNLRLLTKAVLPHTITYNTINVDFWLNSVGSGGRSKYNTTIGMLF